MYKIIGADQKEYGPITAGQVREWVAEGRLNGQSKIQVDGSGQWMQLRDMPEFAALAPPAPPSIRLGAPPASPSPAPARPANPLAGWALGAGIASLPCCAMPILSLVSIVLGMMALSQINRNPNQSGRGLAAGGIVLGCISLVMAIICWVIWFLAAGVSQTRGPFFN
jgi:hypothetical protein